MEAFRSVRLDFDDSLDLDAFEADLRGSILLPGSPDYDAARLVNSALSDGHPALIVRAADATDVARTVALARESGLELSIRAGGHSLAGHGTNDGGIVLDLRGMKGLHIDPDRRLAWAQPGLTATRVHGRGGGPRARDAVRRHGLGRHRRADARWRHRLAGAQARPGHRRPRVGRDRDRGRSRRDRQRGIASRPVLGGARRRRQLRRRDPLPVPALPGRRDLRWGAVHAGHPRRPAQPRADRVERAGGADHDLVPHGHAARAVRPGRAGRHDCRWPSCSCGPAIRPTVPPPSRRSARSRRRWPSWRCRCRIPGSTPSSSRPSSGRCRSIGRAS